MAVLDDPRSYIPLHRHRRILIQTMGDSRICSRGFPGSFVVHGALARRRFFIITTPTFHINCCIYHDTIAKDSPQVILYIGVGSRGRGGPPFLEFLV